MFILYLSRQILNLLIYLLAGSYNFDRRHVQILRDFVVQFPIVLFIEVCKRDKYYLILYKEFVVIQTTFF